MLLKRWRIVMVPSVMLVMLGIVCGLTTARDDTPKNDQQKSAPTKPPEPNPDDLLPAGRMPTPAAVSLDQDKLVVRIRISNLAMPNPAGVPPTPVAKELWHQTRYLLDTVEVYDTQAQKVDGKELPRLLSKPVIAFVYHNKQKVNPLFARLLKPGTLVFVL